MKELIENFSLQINEALQIGEAHSFKTKQRTFTNVVICGLGGSGIGGSFVKDVTIGEIDIPINLVKGYFLPKFANENSLVIISSYSGNTEETLNCLQEALERNLTICAISSNGKVKQICKENGLDCITIPGGDPPRASLGYSATQLFFILAHFGLISDKFKELLGKASELIKNDLSNIQSEAKNLADKLQDKIPVLYSSNHIESVAVRWRQQINENGKQLCWHNVVPEMNHNELVGWREKNEKLAVVFLRNDNDFSKVATRMDLNKKVYETYTSSIHEIWSKGNSLIERAIYLMILGDWVSFYLAEFRDFDVTEVKVIDELKANLS